MYLDDAAGRNARPRTSALPAPVRVAVLDDHAALRAGVQAMLDREPDLVAVGAAAGENELWPLLQRTRPALVVLDLHHPGRSGLALSVLIKRQAPAPRVVLYSGSPAESLAVAARFAGADAVVEKTDSPRALLEAIRGDLAPEAFPPRLLRQAAAGLDPTQRAILAMRLAGTSPAEVARTLGFPASELVDRTLAILAALVTPRARRPAASLTRRRRAQPVSRTPSQRLELRCEPA